MPLQNRVTPQGAIIATPERGTFFGNRGVLHDEQRRLRRAWQLKRWLICVLEFRGRHREVMAPRRYTELFFLDEATALAAGHRPCAECRHARYVAFKSAWLAANGGGSGPLKAEAMDERLHAERLLPDRSQRTFQANLDCLPDGVFMMLPGREQAYLLWKDWLHAWSPGGYQDRLGCPRGQRVAVLTPRSTVEVLRAGYVPNVHPSA